MDDVIIVGAGPAGCNMANLLANAGFKVTVFESMPNEHEYFCGELIETKLAERDSKLKFSKDMIFNKYKSSKLIFAHSGKEVKVPIKNSFLVDTQLLKTKLMQNAKSKGAKFVFNARILGVIKKKGKVTGVKTNSKEYFAKIVAGCDGSNSTVARTAGFDTSNFKALPSFRWKFKNCKGLDASCAKFYLYDRLGLGYLWLYPASKTKCNVGIGGIDAPQMNEIFNQFIKEESALKDAEVYHKGAEMIPYTGILPKIAMKGCLLVGESAGQVHSLLGGGVNSALFASKLASKVIIKALKENSYDKGGLDEYDSSYRKSEDGRMIETETKMLLGAVDINKKRNVIILLNKAMDLLTPADIRKGATGRLTVLNKAAIFLRHPIKFIILAINAITK